MRIDPHLPTPTGTERKSPVDAIQPVNPHQGAHFEAVLNKRERLARRSLRSTVEQSSAGEGVSPGMFGTARSLEILEYVLREVLVGLDADPESKALAHQLIEEEIDMRRTLEQQRVEVDA